MSRALWTVILLPACLALAAAGRCNADTAAARVPLLEKNGMFFVKVRVHDSSKDLLFLLDTGAGRSLIDHKTATKLELTRTNAVTINAVNGRMAGAATEPVSVSIGKSSSRSLSLISADLTRIGATLGVWTQGILGLDYFDGVILEVDGPARSLAIFPRWATAAGNVLPMQRVNDAFAVFADVDSSARLLRVDTGCQGHVELSGPGCSSRGAGSSVAVAGIRNARRRNVHLALGNLAMDVPAVLHQRGLFPGEAGLLGNAFLKQHRIILDTTTLRMAILPSIAQRR